MTDILARLHHYINGQDVAPASGAYLRSFDPGTGVAVQFREVNREGRERMFKILEFVQKTTTFYNNRYLDSLTKG